MLYEREQRCQPQPVTQFRLCCVAMYFLGRPCIKGAGSSGAYSASANVAS